MGILYRILILAGLSLCPVSAQTIFYSQNFEGSPSNVNVSGGGWEFGVPTYGPSAAAEGARCAGTILSGDYGNNAAYELTTAAAYISGSNPKLAFYEWYSTQSSYDYLNLEIEQNYSGSWTTLRSPVSGSQTSWVFRTYDLSSYNNSNIRIRFRLTSNASGQYAGWYIDDLKIFSSAMRNLNVTNDGHGTTSPNGNVSIETSVPYSITATPSSGYRFTNWTVQGGSATFANASSASTTVQITGDATVKANFAAGTLYSITNTPTQYNYTANYYDVSPSNGVRFCFTAPSAGNFAVTVQNVESHTSTLQYFGTDNLFGSVVSSKSISGTTSSSISFNASGAGAKYYFKMVPSSSSYWTYNFRISYASSYSLTVTNDGHGTTTPASPVLLPSGGSQTISASASSGYRFTNWTVQSGTATLADANASSTSAQISNDATVKANFSAGTLYSISNTAVQYNYTTDYYDVNPSRGVRFCFTAPSAGNFAVTVQNVESHTSTLQYFGTDNLFGSVVSSKSISGTTSSSISFNASGTGAKYYFKVVPSSSSYWTYNFRISYASSYSLTVTNDGHGTTTPASPVLLPSGESQTISASASSGYRFTNWTVQSGTATLADASASSTSVQISNDATVKAIFSAGTLYSITNTARQYNYATNYYDVSPTNGVRFCFTAPSAGSFAVSVQNVDSHTSTLQYFGTDNLFGSVVSSKIISVTSTASIAFNASGAGAKYYFRVLPNGSSYWTKNFMISYIDAYSLTVSNDGNGTTHPSGNTPVLSGETVSVTASPLPTYRFKNWTIVSGTPVIANANAITTTVSTSANAEIKANFELGNVYSITSSIVGYNFTTNSFETSPDSGVRFKFVPPGNGHFVVTLKNTDSSALHFYDYGTDSTFRTFLNDQRSSRWNLQYSFSATAGVPHYFKASPMSSSGWTKNFAVYWAPGLSLSPDSVSAILPPGGILNEHKQLHLPADIAPPKADILICMDLTGSMGSALANVKTNAVAIMNQIRGIMPDTRFGATSMMDYPISPYGSSSDYPYRLNSGLSDNISTVSTSINSMSLGNGSDGPESYTRALYESYSDSAVHWRQGAKRFVLLWGDAIPHDLNCELDCGLSALNTNVDPGRDGAPNTADDLVLSTILADMSRNNITLIVLYNGYSYNDYWKCYAQKTGGNAFQINSDGTVPGGVDIATYLSGLITQNVKQIDTLRLKVCTPGYESWLTSVTPAFYTGVSLDSAKDFSFDISLRVPATVTTGVHNFEVCAIGDGAEYISQKVRIALAGTNRAPEADCGPDQILYSTGSSCSVTALLDGSASTDPDGDLLTFSWTGSFGGTLTGVSPSVSLSPGIYQVVLTVSDSEGMSDSDTMSISVKDTVRPVPQLASLPVLRGDCSLHVNSIPQATDNCSGALSAVTTDPTNYSAQGTYTIHWTYTDASGNVAAQEQTVIINDKTAPVISVKPDINRVISALADSAAITVDSATATDNCTSVSISAVRDDGRAFSAYYHTGKTTISWIVCDGNGNCDTAYQYVNITKNIMPVIVKPSDTAMNEKGLLNLSASASDADGTVPVISLVNPPPFISILNSSGTASITLTPGCSDHGTYMVGLQASDGIDSVSDSFQIRVDDVNFAPVIADIPAQKTVEQQPYTLNVNVSDCDGTLPSIRLVNSIPGALFTDNRNSTGTLQWTPAGDANGYYVVIFEATDGVSVVRDTVLIEVVDANCYQPVLNVSNTSVNTSKNLPVTILVSATDSDGVVPVIGATDLPVGSVFTIDDAAGTGVFNWTPSDTGTYSFTIKATDAADPSVVINCNVVIYVNGSNVTGPVFVNRNDTIIDQNCEMIMRFEAQDPDGSVPQLYLISGPAGAKVVDNRNGTGSVVWTAPCDFSGSSAIILGATDQLLYDTLAVNVSVRDVNCPPVINKIPDIVAGIGELVKFTVSAYDPDNNGSVPMLSSACNIQGATFTTMENGTAEFKCVSPSVPGTYPLVFYATDGSSIDSMVVILSVAKFGQIKIIAAQNGARIYSMPSGSYYGSLLGTDSAVCTVPQGTSWFEVQADGYQAKRFPCTVGADSAIIQNVNLKPSIPLMVSMPDTLTIASSEPFSIAGSMSFADLDRDRIVDLFIASDKKCSFFGGLDSLAGISYRYLSTVFNNQTIGYDVVHQVITDWDNNGIYEYILSDRSGNIISVSQKGIKDTLINDTGLNYPVVFDVDRDGKKDLIVHKEGAGLYLYPNIGTDNAPVIGSAVECRYAPQNLPVNNGKGAPVFADIDNDNLEEMILLTDKVLKVYDIDNTFTALTYKEDLNCAGERIKADSLCMALIDSPRGMPKLAIRTDDKILIYRFRLLGDVNNDGVVNVQDISKISKQLEMKSAAPGYERINNLKLSDTGDEAIDVKDISRAGKCWEMKE